MKNGFRRVLRAFVAIIFITPTLLLAQGTAFTYQGRLNDGGTPANGLYDLRFTVYDSTNLPGVIVGAPLTNSGTIVTNGLFTVALDFGAGVFTGPDRWLEIGVRTNGVGAFSTLSARQPIAPTPYAMNAANLGGALHVSANNTNGSPNIIGGSVVNQVDPGTVGAVIAGGGATNYLGITYSNRVAASYSAVGGGIGNVNQSFGSVISGGALNQIQAGGTYDGIGSGQVNLIEAGTDQSFIGGGYRNNVRSFARSSFIGGGQYNTNGSAYSVIAGGQNNLTEFSADSSGIVGGFGNSIRSNSVNAFIGGGVNNSIQANSPYATIAGGANNRIDTNANISMIAGGHDNVIQSAYFAFIGAGGYHQILSNSTDSAIVSGGYNTIQPNASDSFIGGGAGNTIGSNSSYSMIGGGANNLILQGSQYAAIAGGYHNTIQTNSSLSMIAGGHENIIQNAAFSFIGAGGYHQIQSNAFDSAIVAGGYNTIQPDANGSFIGGGYSHTIQSNATSSVIGGGNQNTIQPNAGYSFIGGGYLNTIQFGSFYSTIGGGGVNTIQPNAWYSTIAGGINHTIETNAYASTIGGGNLNLIQSNAFYATIPGGYLNLVAGPNGFAAGQQAQALHAGSFVWSDMQSPAFSSTTSNQFNVRAANGLRVSSGGNGNIVEQVLSDAGDGYQALNFNGFYDQTTSVEQRFNTNKTRWRLVVDQRGTTDLLTIDNFNGSSVSNLVAIMTNGNVGIGTNSPTQKLSVVGNIVATGTVTGSSDRNAKEHFATVDSRDVLEKVASLPITRWSYKADDGVTHLGPMAQDFYGAFNIGMDDKHISMVDADGVALAAIQGLNQKMETENATLRAENVELKKRLEKLERLMDSKLAPERLSKL